MVCVYCISFTLLCQCACLNNTTPSESIKTAAPVPALADIRAKGASGQTADYCRYLWRKGHRFYNNSAGVWAPHFP